MKKKLVLFVTLMFIFIPTTHAQTLNDLYNKLASLEEKYASSNNSKKLTESEINEISRQINDINASIASAQSDISKAQKDIQDSYVKIEEKKQETDELLKFLQVSSGGNAYLEYLFDADNYTDFIYRYAIVSQMSGYNNKLMEELETLINDLEEKKKVLAQKEESLQAQRDEVSNKRDVLRANLSELTTEGTTIEQDIADLKKDIEYYTSLGCSRNQDLSSCVKQPSASGWTYPLHSGCVSSEYTSYRLDWGVGSEHHGIDLACNPEGTNVYATAAGTVARIVDYSTCGGKMVYVYHRVNGVEYTSVYMHLLSINVGYGQTVNENTVIGKVGGGSTASVNGGYDRCTTGAHLHFGLASGHVAYSFNSYSFNPRDIFTFPQIGGGYFYR